MSLTLLLLCHNSVPRLRPTLEHLLAQTECEGVEWSVVLVDNASTDGTAEFARGLLSRLPVPWKIVQEPRLGLRHAFESGLAACTGALISLVDDDNWICPTWVAQVSRTMARHPEVGLLISNNLPVFEQTAPAWFTAIQGNFACGQAADQAGYVVDPCRAFGAGSTLRRAALEELFSSGYTPFNVGRQGKKLSSCEDTERSLALADAGWRHWYEPTLTLRHFMPTGRLLWPYARRLMRGVGGGNLGLTPYWVAEDKLRHRRYRLWSYWMARQLGLLARQGHHLFLLLRHRPGDRRVLALEHRLGFLAEGWSQRARFKRHLVATLDSRRRLLDRAAAASRRKATPAPNLAQAAEGLSALGS